MVAAAKKQVHVYQAPTCILIVILTMSKSNCTIATFCLLVQCMYISFRDSVCTYIPRNVCKIIFLNEAFLVSFPRKNGLHTSDCRMVHCPETTATDSPYLWARNRKGEKSSWKFVVRNTSSSFCFFLSNVFSVFTIPQWFDSDTNGVK